MAIPFVRKIDTYDHQSIHGCLLCKEQWVGSCGFKFCPHCGVQFVGTMLGRESGQSKLDYKLELLYRKDYHLYNSLRDRVSSIRQQVEDRKSVWVIESKEPGPFSTSKSEWEVRSAYYVYGSVREIHAKDILSFMRKDKAEYEATRVKELSDLELDLDSMEDEGDKEFSRKMWSLMPPRQWRIRLLKRSEVQKSWISS